mmetsp:Transcript_18012/g.50041  ORF Transcript_18012/g.50041 Transcript_18012/m.50041 type:complete len:267 (+) Transcript_18012:237-1037(+)
MAKAKLPQAAAGRWKKGLRSEEPGEAVAGEGGLRDRPAECEHGKSPILQLLEPHQLGLVLLLRQEVHAQPVVSSVCEGYILNDLGVCGDHLDDSTENEWPEEHTVLKRQPRVSEPRRKALELVWKEEGTASVDCIQDAGLVALRRAGDPHKIRHDHAHDGQHRHTPMLEFRLPEPRQVLWEAHGEAGRIEIVGPRGEGGLTADQPLGEDLHHLFLLPLLDVRIRILRGLLRCLLGATDHRGGATAATRGGLAELARCQGSDAESHQ